MITRTDAVSLLVAFALAGTAACGSKNKREETTGRTHERPAATADNTPIKREVAQGELREAILKLRRVHFAFDGATITDDGRQALAEAGEVLVQYPRVHLYVQGHADERGTSEYNIALGDRRAKAVADFLVNLGMPRDRLHIVSYGEEMPIAAGTTAQALAKNRRVDFRVMRGEAQLVVEEGQLVDDAGKPMK